MIIQGRNNPIIVEFDTKPIDVSVSLRSEIEEYKHWEMVDLTEDEEDELVYYAPITQEESMSWGEGTCWVEVKWTEEDDDNNVQTHFARAKDYIRYWGDDTILNEEADES